MVSMTVSVTIQPQGIIKLPPQLMTVLGWMGVVTHNSKHFSKIQGLYLEDWTTP